MQLGQKVEMSFLFLFIFFVQLNRIGETELYLYKWPKRVIAISFVPVVYKCFYLFCLFTIVVFIQLTKLANKIKENV